MKRILVLGDSTQPLWHPLSNLEPLTEELRSGYEVVETEDYPDLERKYLETFDVCINYMDNWENRGTRKAQEALCGYVEDGGRMLTLHTGIITKKSRPLLVLNGGAFTGHAEAGILTYRYCGTDPTLGEGAEDFELFEEPYRYELLRPQEMTLFLEYRHGGEWYPAGWHLPCGRGKVVYLAPGHDREAFRNPSYLRQIRNALKFLGV
ncbi:MAG: ThuA domain-containing protein [bacterium]|nr:ThuA domain-containing protein [bacterium]